MLAYNKHIPVLFFIKNEEKSTLIVTILRQIKPAKVYITVGEELTSQNINNNFFNRIESMIDWDCEICFLIQNVNDESFADCKIISQFFELESKGIILSDDFLPTENFFVFCSELLEKYEEDERIGHISGWYMEDKSVSTLRSYQFSSFPITIGGWATWRRAWMDLDLKMKTYPYFKSFNYIHSLPNVFLFKEYWIYAFDAFYHYNKEDNWILQYTYMSMVTNRLSIVPTINLFETDQELVCNNENTLNKIVHPQFYIANGNVDRNYQETHVFRSEKSEDLEDGYAFMKNMLASEENVLRIPRLMHQLYESPTGVPLRLKQLSESWTEKNPSWKYMFWGTKEIDVFLNDHFPDFIPFYRDYEFDVQRWDAIRYLILYTYGGLYIDMDYECLQPIDKILTNKGCFLGMEPKIHSALSGVPYIIGNAFMASVPGHDFMKCLIEELYNKEKYTNPDKKRRILQTTGPLMLSRVYEDYQGKADIGLIPSEIVTPLSSMDVRSMHLHHKSAEIKKKLDNAFAVHYFNYGWESLIRN